MSTQARSIASVFCFVLTGLMAIDTSRTDTPFFWDDFDRRESLQEGDVKWRALRKMAKFIEGRKSVPATNSPTSRWTS